LPLSVEKFLVPDEYFFRVEALVKAPKEKRVLRILGELDSRVRTLKVVYRGGRFYTSKNCTWQKEKLVCRGYQGEIAYEFSSASPEVQERVIEVFEELKSRYPRSFSYFLRGEGWRVSYIKLKKEKEALTLRLVKRTLKLARRLGNAFKGKCVVKEINYAPSGLPSFPLRAVKTMSLPEPVKSSQLIRVKALVTFECFQKD